MPHGPDPRAPTRLSFKDLDALRELGRTLGWPHTEADWRTILLSGLVYGLRAGDDAEGAPIDACAALFPYGEDACALGMVMVAPAAQRCGLGRRVVQHCLDARPHDGVPVFLASTVEGEGLYRALGFREVGRLVKLMADGPVAIDDAPPAGWRLARKIAMADLVGVMRLDRRAFGGARETFLKHRIGQADRTATIFDGRGRLSGYGLAVRQGDLSILGPVVADDDAAVQALVGALAAGHGGPLRIDVPVGCEALWRRLQALGFHEADRPPLMALAAEGLPAGGWSGYAAIAAQAFL